MKYLKLFESYNKEVIEDDIKECMFDLTDDYDYQFHILDGMDASPSYTQLEYNADVSSFPTLFPYGSEITLFKFDFKIDINEWVRFTEKMKYCIDLVNDRLDDVGLKLTYSDVFLLHSNGYEYGYTAMESFLTYYHAYQLNSHKIPELDKWIEHFTKRIHQEWQDEFKLKISFGFYLPGEVWRSCWW